MTYSHIIANCFMGLVAVIAVAGQIGLVTGLVGPA